jgi:hypothetical protein
LVRAGKLCYENAMSARRHAISLLAFVGSVLAQLLVAFALAAVAQLHDPVHRR